MHRKIKACFAAALAGACLLTAGGCGAIGAAVQGMTEEVMESLQQADPEDFTQKKQQDVPMDGVQKLVLECGPTRDTADRAVAVSVQMEASPDDRLHLRASANCDVPDKYLPSAVQKGAELKISTGDGLDGTSAFTKERMLQVTVQVPEDYQNTFHIAVNAGLFRADTLHSQDCQLTVSAGGARVGHFVGAGRITVNAGSAEIGDVALSGDLELKVNAGSAECEMKKGSSFRFSAQKAAGALETYFPTEKRGDWGRKQAATVGGDPRHTLTVSVNAGSLELTEGE